MTVPVLLVTVPQIFILACCLIAIRRLNARISHLEDVLSDLGVKPSDNDESASDRLLEVLARKIEVFGGG